MGGNITFIIKSDFTFKHLAIDSVQLKALSAFFSAQVNLACQALPFIPGLEEALTGTIELIPALQTKRLTDQSTLS